MTDLRCNCVLVLMSVYCWYCGICVKHREVFVDSRSPRDLMGREYCCQDIQLIHLIMWLYKGNSFFKEKILWII